MSYTIQNPILPGFYPDPSICRKGDDFYLACSSFSFFPGVPLFHSRDLAHWESIGYVLTDPAVLRLTPERLSGGIFAPTIRYQNGKFYVIVGNVTTGETLLSIAEDPKGPWETHVIEEPGGDPSLFWDDDGSCWCSYSAMGFGSGAHGIGQRRLDLERFELVGEEHFLWAGSAADAWSPEASHIYKKDGWYYLIIAEGGTEHHHAVCVARSRALHGPYVNFRANPILTHRHLGMNYPICNVGHADIIDTPAGEWYMVALASRLYGGYHKNMGRETFICPMDWEGDWPVVAPGEGRIAFEYPAPKLPEFPVAAEPLRDDFDSPVLTDCWNTLGTPANSPVRVADGALFIRALPEAVWRETPPRMGMPDMEKLSDEEKRKLREQFRARRVVNPVALGFLGRRQQHPSYTATALLRFNPCADSETAGLMLLQNDYNQLRIELAREKGATCIRVLKYADVTPSASMGNLMPSFDVEEEHGTTLLGQMPYQGDSVVLRLVANGQLNSFYAGSDEAHLCPVALNIPGGFLGSESAGGFVGAYIGLFASGNGADTGNEAAFDWFEYRGA